MKLKVSSITIVPLLETLQIYFSLFPQTKFLPVISNRPAHSVQLSHHRNHRPTATKTINMFQSSTIKTKDGIEWYCERQGTGPNLILIPSGEGDCGSLVKVADILSDSFTVTIFDMPGMSRSTAPPHLTKAVTGPILADQVAGLMDELNIDAATFYGSSSGGSTSLCMAAQHPTRVRNALVHEIALGTLGPIEALLSMDDAAAVASCREMFAHDLNEDIEVWEALGPEYHARLEKNYLNFVRNVVASVTKLSLSKEELTRRPVDWTISALFPAGAFFSNVLTATGAGLL